MLRIPFLKLACLALRMLRYQIRMSKEQSDAYETVLQLLEGIPGAR